MTTEPAKPASPPEVEPKNKESLALDIEDDDGNTSEEELNLSIEDKLATDKLAARRKIEMYWEKRRLKEQLGDFDDADLDF
jgi:hypothetical protein